MLGSGGDNVVVDCKVGNQRSGTAHLEGVGGLGGNYLTAIRPAHEVVASGGRGHEGGGGEVVIVAGACHCAVLGGGGDNVVVDGEVGVDDRVTYSSNIECCVSAKFNTANISPVHEVVSCCSSSHIVGIFEVFDGGRAFHATHVLVASVVARHVDSHVVYVGVEVSGEGTVAIGVDGNALLGARDLVVAIGPVDEVVAGVGRGSEGNGQVELHRGGATHSAELRISVSGSDGEEGTVVVDIDDGVAMQDERLAVGSAEHSAVFVSPVHEVVSIDSLATGEGHARVVVEVGERHGIASHAAQHIVLGVFADVDSHGVAVALADDNAIYGGWRIGTSTTILAPHEDNLIGAIGRHGKVRGHVLPLSDILKRSTAVNSYPASGVTEST